MNTIAKFPRWHPITEISEKPDPMAIDFVMTKAEKDHAILCELERRAMQAHRVPPGYEVGEATWDEFQAVRDAFRVRYG